MGKSSSAKKVARLANKQGKRRVRSAQGRIFPIAVAGVVGAARRLGDAFRYEVVCEEMIEPGQWRDEADPVRWITQRYTAALERVVRRDPEQYLWLHRRWKHRPPERGVRARRTLSAS